jgi:sugar lactone lactonase YvrE
MNKPPDKVSPISPRRFLRASVFLAISSLAVAGARGQSSYAPPNDLPNPYRVVMNWAHLPDGRKWGAIDGIDVGPDGNIWAFDRCGADTCAGSDLEPVFEFSPEGQLLRHFGAGRFVFPHGIYVDQDGNVWLTDARASGGKGLQVFKFSPDGKVLLTIGTAGVAGEGENTFGSPTDVVVSEKGEIFISDGHKGCDCPNARIVKFSKAGKFIKAWGKKGSGPGEFDGPHALAFDSKGRLLVADRSNNRIEIFDQDGNFLEMWKQFGRPSGMYIDRDDTLYVADSESRDTEGYGNNPGVKRGVRIGSARTGQVKYLIPAPASGVHASAAEGVAADHQGNVYGAEVHEMDVKKYAKQ